MKYEENLSEAWKRVTEYRATQTVESGYVCCYIPFIHSLITLIFVCLGLFSSKISCPCGFLAPRSSTTFSDIQNVQAHGRSMQDPIINEAPTSVARSTFQTQQTSLVSKDSFSLPRCLLQREVLVVSECLVQVVAVLQMA